MRPARWLVLVWLALATSCNGGDGTGNGPGPASYTVQIAVTGLGSVEVTGDATGSCRQSCSMSATAGGRIVLTAVPDEGATFQGWSGACSGTGACSLTVDSDLAVAGVFESVAPTPTFVLTIDLAGDGSGVVTSAPGGVTCAATDCSGTFERGTSVTLTATPDAESRFAGWDGAGCSGTAICELVLTAATTVTARFAHGAPGTYALKLLSHPGGMLYGTALDARGDAAGTFYADGSHEARVFLYDALADEVAFPLPDEAGRCEIMNDTGMLLVGHAGGWYRFLNGELLSALGDMEPYAMNVRGWVSGRTEVGAGPFHAAMDDGAAVLDLDPSGTVPSMATGINSGGVVVGVRGDEAVVFEAGGPRDLDVPPASAALDVSDDGKVVGNARRTFKWSEQAFVLELSTGEVTLIDRPTGASGVSLDRINRAGTIAVGQSFSADGTSGPVVYRGGELLRLAPLVELPEGMRLQDARDVNDRGQILVTVIDEQGTWGTALLTPR